MKAKLLRRKRKGFGVYRLSNGTLLAEVIYGESKLSSVFKLHQEDECTRYARIECHQYLEDYVNRRRKMERKNRIKIYP